MDAVGERAGRHIDRIVDRTWRFRTCSRMVRVLAPEPLPSSAIIRLEGRNSTQVVGVRVDHAGVGARQAVLGQKRDGFEESRTDVVVEIAAGQSLLLGLGQAGPHVARELCVQRLGEHQDFTIRKVAYT